MLKKILVLIYLCLLTTDCHSFGQFVRATNDTTDLGIAIDTAAVDFLNLPAGYAFMFRADIKKPVKFACMRPDDIRNLPPLQYAMLKHLNSDYGNEVIKWLCRNGAELNAYYRKKTPLHMAIGAHSDRFTKTLLSEGAELLPAKRGIFKSDLDIVEFAKQAVQAVDRERFDECPETIAMFGARDERRVRAVKVVELLESDRIRTAWVGTVVRARNYRQRHK